MRPVLAACPLARETQEVSKVQLHLARGYLALLSPGFFSDQVLSEDRMNCSALAHPVSIATAAGGLVPIYAFVRLSSILDSCVRPS